MSYNGPLLLKWDLHINIVVCRGLKMMRYLHKYIHKGIDMLKTKMQAVLDGSNRRNEQDEISLYQKSR